MKLPSRVYVRRDIQVAHLCERLADMYTRAGAKIVGGTQDQTITDANALELARKGLDKREVEIVPCAIGLLGAFDTYFDWFACGAVVITSTAVLWPELYHVEETLTSLRTHFGKSASDLLGCDVCTGPCRDVTCRRCWHGLCKRCFAHTHLHARTSLWRCPFCRAEADVESVVCDMDFEARRTGKSSLPVIRDEMVRLNATETQIVISGDILSGERAGSYDRSTWASLQVVRKRRRGSTRTRKRVLFDTLDLELVQTLLRTPGTVFTVGEIPFYCNGCDRSHGDLDAGGAFMVTTTGVDELVGAFAPLCTISGMWATSGAHTESETESESA